MPTTITSFAADEISIRWKDPFFTEAANAKLAGVVPRGVFDGFRLGTSAVTDTVTIAANAAGLHLAHYTTDTGYGLTVRRSGGDFTITMPVTAGARTYAVAIYAVYAHGVTTSAEIRVYELSPTDELTGAAEEGEVVILGVVTTVAGGGVIPAANISPTQRVAAGQTTAAEAVPWIQALANPSFDIGDAGKVYENAAPFWRLVDNANVTIDLTSAEARTGTYSVNINAATTAPDFELRQDLNMEVREGQIVRVRLYYRCLVTLASGSVDVQVVTRDAAGSATTTVLGSLDLSTTNGAIDREFDVAVEVAAGTALLASIQLVPNAATFSGTGDALRVDDFQAWVSARDGESAQDFLSRFAHRAMSGSLVLSHPDATVGQIRNAIEFLPANNIGFPTLTIQKADRDGTSTNQPWVDLKGQLQLGENLRDTSAKALQYRLRTRFASTTLIPLYLLWENSDADATEAATRLYGMEAGEFFLTYNAKWNGSQWTKDVNGAIAAAFEFTGLRFRISWQEAATNTWASFTSQPVDFNINSLVNTLLGQIVLGSGLLSTAADAETARIGTALATTAVATRTLIWESQGTSHGNKQLRVYLTGSTAVESESIEFAINCSWSEGSAQWTADDPGTGTNNSAQVLRIWRRGLRFYNKSDTTVAWAESGWDGAGANGLSIDVNAWQGRVDLHDGLLHFDNVSAAGSNPAPGDGMLVNTLYAKTTPKAWGRITTGASPSIDEGFNISAVSTGASVCNVDLVTAVTDPGAIAVVTVNSLTSPYGATVVQSTSTRFVVQMYTAGSAGFLTSLNSTAITFSIVVFGEQ